MRSASSDHALLEICAVCFVLGFAAGCAKSSQTTAATDEAAIRATDAQWSDAAEANHVGKTASYYTSDALLLAPNEPLH